MTEQKEATRALKGENNMLLVEQKSAGQWSMMTRGKRG